MCCSRRRRLMSYTAIETLLRESIGLDPASLGAGTVERAVRGRLRACRLDDAAAYLQLLRNDEIERQELIEAVVVPETWFFRNMEAFAALTRLLQRSEKPLRLLSLPCSTGEE